tara:strand:+ start:745 stop:1356 length:612 start_codon:yes stop_codon:yes gene_type:complete
MSKISTYASIQAPSIDDKLIGTDIENENLTKNFTISSILALTQLSLTSVLTAVDTTDQFPDATDTPLQVTFGGAQKTASDPVMLSNNGDITFNQAGIYLFNGYANFERQGSNGGVSVILFRSLINGVQAGPTKGVELSVTGIMIPYELTLPIQVNAGDVLTWQIMRDSSGSGGGQNSGGLYTHTTSGAWSNVPSADVNIYKIG